MATMQLDIITAEKVAYSGEVEALLAPGIEGELGILPHHAPLMTMLQPGELMVRKDGQETFLAVTGGFLEVMENRVSILADAAERSEDIDEERAQAAVKKCAGAYCHEVCRPGPGTGHGPAQASNGAADGGPKAQASIGPRGWPRRSLKAPRHQLTR